MDTPDSSTPARFCITCGVEYPSTREFFCPVVRGKYLSRDCRSCNRLAKKKYINPKKEQERHKVYREANKGKIAASDKEYRKKNVERRKAYNNRWNADHREQARATEKAYKQRRPEVRQGIKARRRAAEGSHTTTDLEAIRAAQTDKRGRLRCWYCGKPVKGSAHLEHKIPLSRGGTNWPSNLCYACEACNLHKSKRTHTEFSGVMF